MVDEIAVIDDDAMIRKSVTFMLSDQYAVQVYESSDRFLEVSKGVNWKKPKLIILDLMMPGTNGKTLLTYLKGNAELKEIPVIILSAKNDLDEAKELEKIGAELYIEKPFDFGFLSSKVEEILNSK